MIKHITASAILATIAIPTLAQVDIKTSTPHSAYAQDGRGNIVRNNTGLCWRTGYWTPADAVAGCDGALATPVATTPNIVAAANTPKPEAKPTPQKRCDFSVTLQNDETFDFNQAALKSTTKQHIDNEVMSKIAACSKVNIIIVTGHTDLIGSHPYNQKLSEKRADAVANYIASKGITAQIDTMGMGKTQQIKACDEKLSRPKLAECLSPNRRVVVEVQGLSK